LGIKRKKEQYKKEQKQKRKTWISPNTEICTAEAFMFFVTCFLQLYGIVTQSICDSPFEKQ
jgi:hypothetical protein